MDAAIKLHHATIRRVMEAHSGYETATGVAWKELWAVLHVPSYLCLLPTGRVAFCSRPVHP